MVRRKLGAREFAKYHGLGNDYLVVDAAKFGGRLTPKRVRGLCDRHRGPGADGIVALVAPRFADFAVRIYNPDGSEAEKSGNGLRIFARALFDLGYTRRQRFGVETKGGLVEARLHLRSGEVSRVTVAMGRASFAADTIPVVNSGPEVVDQEWQVCGRSLRVTAVSVGNPHCVVFVPELDRDDLLTLGPALESDSRFPQRTNVQLARVHSRTRIDVLVWERGAGETLASGSSSCAVAAAAVRLGRAERRVTIRMPGGDLPVTVGRDFALELSGPATPVYRASLL